MFVYAIGSSIGLVKIGKAGNPERRLADLQVGSPVRLFIIAVRNCGSDAASEQIEREIHRDLEGYNERGEWFRVTLDDLRQHFPHVPEIDLETDPDRMASITEFYWSTIPNYPDHTRANLRLLHNAETDEALIKLLITKCATGQLPGQQSIN